VQIHLDPSGIREMIDARRVDATRDIRLLESERAAVGHEECVGIIFDAWQLPDSLVAAGRHHHDPMAAPEAHRELAALVNLGANLALACGSTFTLEPAPVEPHGPAMTQLGLAEEQLNRVAAELPKRIAELRGAVLDV
jgi:HD-like signal output (HDOD) protein